MAENLVQKKKRVIDVCTCIVPNIKVKLISSFDRDFNKYSKNSPPHEASLIVPGYLSIINFQYGIAYFTLIRQRNKMGEKNYT
jgi:hypothetical protein